MAIYFARSTGGFYDETIAGPRGALASLIPADAVVVTLEQHQALLEAQAAGKVIAPGVAGEPMAIDRPAPTSDQLKAMLSGAVQKMLDDKAKTFGFDGIQSAATYADESAVATFQHQGAALRAWRSLVWAACYSVMAEVEAGTRPIPTTDQLLAVMPACDL